MLGLHNGPTLWAFVFLVVVVVGLVGLAIGMANRDTTPDLMIQLTVVAIISVLGVGLFVVLTEESDLETRDETIQTQLGVANIQLVGTEDWDQRALVKTDGCTASYQIQVIQESGQPVSWPLVAGSGHAVSGCEGKELDVLFVPTS